MKFERRENTSFPPLAWVATLKPAENIVSLVHGSMVEVGEDYFVEGAWSDDFAQRNFDVADCFFGSGGRVHNQGLVIVPSASTTSYCYLARTPEGSFVITNSLPLALAASDDELDLRSRDYMRLNDSILLGINAYERRLPTRDRFVERLVYKNLHVSAAGVLSTFDRPLPPRFENFSAYRAYLEQQYTALVVNARSPVRHRPLQIYSTQSRGYDSTAMNAIAVKLGLDAVFTVPQGKGYWGK